MKKIREVERKRIKRLLKGEEMKEGRREKEREIMGKKS